MEELQPTFLDQVHPGFPMFKVTVKLDRSFSRERINLVGPDSRPMKKVVSVDVVVYDERGTRMLAKLMTEAARDRLMWLIHLGAVYKVVNPSVDIGGQGIHEHYHLQFHEDTILMDSYGDFLPLPYNLKTVSKVPWCMKLDEGFFDVLGFVKHISPVTKDKHMGYWENVLHVVLETHKKGMGWPRDEVGCFLRGSCVEAYEKILRDALNGDDPVFVHVRYVRSCEPLGIPSVSSYSDATTVNIDPPIPEVQKLKHQMIDFVES